MAGTRSISLTRRALQPGADLSHDHYHTVPVDALHALGRCKSEIGSAILHAKFGEVDIERMRAATLVAVMDLFAMKGWEVEDRKLYSVADTLKFFVIQVVDEFLGEPCPRCRGRGFLGMIYGKIWHQMHKCEACMGRGYTKALTKSSSISVKKQLLVRRPCAACLGKKLVNVVHDVKPKRTKPCRNCRGTGKKLASSRARARALRYDHSRIIRVWGERFDETMRMLRNHAKAAMAGVDFDIRMDELQGELGSE